MDDQLAQLKKKNIKKYNFLFIDDPASYVKSLSLRKKIRFNSLNNFFRFICRYNEKYCFNSNILFRSHPSSQFNKIKNEIKFFKKKFNLKNKIFFRNPVKSKIIDDISNSNYVFGMQSVALFLSKKINKFTYCCMSKNLIDKYVSTSPIKKNISQAFADLKISYI